METEDILKYVKHNLGLSTSVRDEYLKHIIESTVARTKRAGADPEGQSDDYKLEWVSYIVDEASHMYRNRGGEIPLPYGLRERRNTLIVERQNV